MKHDDGELRIPVSQLDRQEPEARRLRDRLGTIHRMAGVQAQRRIDSAIVQAIYDEEDRDRRHEERKR